MLDAALGALSELFTPSHLFLLLIGVLIGMILGALPGIGALAGLAILLPFTFNMEPNAAFALMMGLMAVGATTDTIPAVLFGVPGSSGAQATIMDGYPMAKKGQAGRALGAAYMSSLIGGLIGAAVLALVLPVFRPLALQIGSPQLFMVTILGITMVAVLSSGAPIKGLLAGCVGLCLGLIGADPRTGEMRWTFDALYLFGGLPTVAVFLGLFGLPEIVDLLAKGTQVSQVPKGAIVGVRQGMADSLRNWPLVVRTSLFGAVLGAVPGIGKSVVDWLAYGHAVMTVKGARKTFGKGDVRGVIAPESANNAVDGGALIPTLVFGVPGHLGMVLLLGAFIIHGITPGPSLVTTHLDVTYTLLWSLALANVMAAGICLMLTPQFAKLSVLRINLLVPAIVCLMFVGTFSSTGNTGDLYALMAFGVIGYFMKKFGWPRPALVLGFVLSAASERYFFISTGHFGLTWLAWPSIMIMMALAAAVLVYGFTMGRRKSGSKLPVTAEAEGNGIEAMVQSVQGGTATSHGAPPTRTMTVGTDSASTETVTDGGVTTAELTGPDSPVPPASTATGSDQPEISTSDGGGGVGARPNRWRIRPSPASWLSLAGVVFFGGGILLSLDWPEQARVFPLVICLPGLALAVLQLLLDIFRPEKEVSRAMDLAPEQFAGKHHALFAHVWIFGFLALVYLFGFYVAIPIYCFSFLRFHGKEKWKVALIYAAILGIGVYVLFDQILALPQPDPALMIWLGLA